MGSETDSRTPSELLMYLQGKRVALVGNAASILAQDYGGEIEDHDIVVRMNRGLPARAQSQGVRTDVLAFSVFPWVAGVYPKFNAKWSVWMSPRFRDTIDETFPPEITFYDLSLWESLRARLGARPSVGAMALDFLSHASPARVSIFGFDFKTSGTFYEQHQHVGPHDYSAERAYCEEMTGANGWTFHRC